MEKLYPVLIKQPNLYEFLPISVQSKVDLFWLVFQKKPKVIRHISNDVFYDFQFFVEIMIKIVDYQTNQTPFEDNSEEEKNIKLIINKYISWPNAKSANNGDFINASYVDNVIVRYTLNDIDSFEILLDQLDINLLVKNPFLLEKLAESNIDQIHSIIRAIYNHNNNLLNEINIVEPLLKGNPLLFEFLQNQFPHSKLLTLDWKAIMHAIDSDMNGIFLKDVWEFNVQKKSFDESNPYINVYNVILASDEIKSKLSVQLKCLKQDGMLLEYLYPFIMDKDELLKIALKQNRNAFKFLNFNDKLKYLPCVSIVRKIDCTLVFNDYIFNEYFPKESIELEFKLMRDLKSIYHYACILNDEIFLDYSIEELHKYFNVTIDDLTGIENQYLVESGDISTISIGYVLNNFSRFNDNYVLEGLYSVLTWNNIQTDFLPIEN